MGGGVGVCVCVCRCVCVCGGWGGGVDRYNKIHLYKDQQIHNTRIYIMFCNTCNSIYLVIRWIGSGVSKLRFSDL